MADGKIDNPGKIGIGTWDKDSVGTALGDVDQVRFSWYFTWNFTPLWDNDSAPEATSFVPMIWDETYISRLGSMPAGAHTLLGFNEPDHPGQANMSVEQALELWPELMATGKRLGSPAPTTPGALGETSWLGRFMHQAEARNDRVDFITVHYYTDNKEIGAFQAYLEAIHQQYGRPIWVTEWSLADWTVPGRFSPQEQAAFAKAATLMMDDLAFVERHAWFSSYGGEGYSLNSEVWNANGELTPVGRVFAELTQPGTTPSTPAGIPVGVSGDDHLTGTAANDRLDGGDGHDRIDGRGGADSLIGGPGHDTLAGGYGNDVLTGGSGQDIFRFNANLGTSTTDRKKNFDRITDFNAKDDTLWLENKIFKKLGNKGSEDSPARLKEAFFKIGTGAKDSNDYLIYNKKTGILTYDADGSGMKTPIEFARLDKSLKLTYKDVFLI